MRRQPVDVVLERADRPRMHVAGRDRHEPAVGAVERLELRRPRERRRRRSRSRPATAAACGTARRARPSRSAAPAGRSRANGASGLQRRAPDLDQVQVRRRRDRPGSFEAEHLAVRRHAERRQPARDEMDVAVEVVGRAQVDEPALDRRLAEEHRGDRRARPSPPRSAAPRSCSARGRRRRRRPRPPGVSARSRAADEARARASGPASRAARRPRLPARRSRRRCRPRRARGAARRSQAATGPA